MPKLEGIIYKTFNHYVVLRGFAPLKDLAAISHSAEAYQRPAILEHKKDILQFLESGEFKYFPEVTLACRVTEYNDFASNIGIDNAIDSEDAEFVSGLKVLSERLPYEGYRARHAYLLKNNSQDLVRVDGNHRLESFDDPNDPVWGESGVNKIDVENIVVPYTVIFSEQEFGDKFEAGIFHNINFRQEPLRQEASLKIISDLGVFDDKEKLGAEYPLALELINRVKTGLFDDIKWLSVNNDIAQCYYRTTCLRIAQLLHNRRIAIEELYSSINNKINNNRLELESVTIKMSHIKGNIEVLESERNDIETREPNFEKLSSYKKLCKELENNTQMLDGLIIDANNLDSEKEHLKFKQGHYSRFLSSSINSVDIINAIYSLKKVYHEFENNQYGNIAMLVTMVYYALLDKAQLNSFVSWVKKNGVNKITEPDDLSLDASENLIEMFEQIFQSKKNEIFISMQFGDSQSELIYEKIVRAIETFNKKHKSIHLSARPIRIDRTVEPSTYSIQDKILEAIEACSLIIADLSSSNINVYHEIGYAMGVAQSNNLHPNLILLYKENTDHNKANTDTDKFVGFNLRNLSQLRFKDYKQLVDGLVERLEKHYGV